MTPKSEQPKWKKPEKLYNKPNFWENILSGPEITDPALLSIRTQIVKVLESKKNWDTLSQEDFITALNSITVAEVKIDDKKKIEQKPEELSPKSNQWNKPKWAKPEELLLPAGWAWSVSVPAGSIESETEKEWTISLEAEWQDLALKPTSEVIKPKTLLEQINEEDSFPFSIDHDWKTIEITFDESSKKLKIWDKSYDISEINKWGKSMMNLFSLESLTFVNWNPALTLEANNKWKGLIDASNLMWYNDPIELSWNNNNLLVTEIMRDDFNKMIEWIITWWFYNYSKQDLKIKIS